MRDLAFAMVWVVLFPVALWSAHIGVLLWIWVALVSPNERLYGFLSDVPFNKIAAGLTLLVLFLNREKKKFYLDATVVLIILLALVGSASAYFAIVPSDDGADLYQKMIKEFLLAALIMGLMWSRHRIHMTVVVLCIAIGFTSVIEGLEYAISGGGHKIIGTGGIGDNNSIALAALLIVPPLYYLTRYSALRQMRVGFMVALVVSLICVVGTFSRGGFIGLLVLFAFFIINSRQKLPAIGLAVIAAAAMWFFASSDWMTRIDTIKDVSDNGSFMGRVIAWKISTLIAIDSPLFGGGFHAVQRYPVWNQYISSIDGLFSFIRTPEPDGIPHAAHSIYFEVLGDLGFAGLILFLLVLAVALYNCHSVARTAKRHPELAWAGDLARMLQISLIVYMVSGAALSMAYFEGFWIIVALLSRLKKTVGETLAVTAVTPVNQLARNHAETPAYARLMPGRG
jgi:probable O-glycosylation ligase (exosortase A-associated)